MSGSKSYELPPLHWQTPSGSGQEATVRKVTIPSQVDTPSGETPTGQNVAASATVQLTGSTESAGARTDEATRETLRCWIIGETTLAISCAEVLLSRGHTLQGFISENPSVRAWASEAKILCVGPQRNIEKHIAQAPFDYLFSIVNPTILSKEVLGTPQRAAINFHDSPLPRYAGTYATTWALMNQEQKHGITWHIMTPQVDAGDILRQIEVAIDPTETAFTLNAKCYQAALQAFEGLIDELATRTCVPKKQNPEERTFFPHTKRPPAGCLIPWNKNAEKIDAFIRSLDFGTYPNPLGIPKIMINQDFFLVPSAQILDHESGAAPGTILDIQNDSLIVASATKAISFSRVLTMEGEPVAIPDLVRKNGLRIGHQFILPDDPLGSRITKISTGLSKHEDFWVERLMALEPCDLPFANSANTREPSGEIGRINLSLPREVLGALRDRFPEKRLDELLLAVFAAYIGRLCQSPAFDIGYSHGELRDEIKGLEGLFAEWLPLRVEVDTEKSFRSYLSLISEEIARVKRSITYGRGVLVRYPELRGAADASLHQGISSLRVLVAGCSKNVPDTVTGSDVALVIRDTGEMQWFYRTDAVGSESISRMIKHFETFLSGTALNADQAVCRLPLLTGPEKHEMLVEWNQTAAAFKQDATIPALFQAQAGQSPDQVAIVCDGEQMTYRQLNARANQLAHHLRGLGVRPETLVGICVERSPDMIVGLLGILKAGGAYVPIDPSYPRDRIAFQLEDTQVPVLLTQEKLVATLPPHLPAKIVRLDGDWGSIARESCEDLASDLQPENLAYIIYTSGSTGKPKGVMVSHQAICNHLQWGQATDPLTREDRILQKTSFGFDVSVWEIFGPLLAGSCLVIARKASPGYDELVGLIVRHQVTILNFVPSALHVFLDEKGIEECKSLRRIFCGGEVLTLELQQRFFHLLNAELHNSYGVTEAAVDSVVWICHPDKQRRIIPIGRPISNTEIYLLDARLEPVPIGVSGEIHIGGTGLARGYLNRPELSAERFIPHPFRPEGRLYKTGDLARYLADGNIELVGRKDHQVKIRGFRIELGEIESVLAQHPNVKEALVLARADHPGDTRLVAYIVPTAKPAASPKDLLAFVKQKLPGSMVPSAVVTLEALPLLPNGKVNRQALPPPSKARQLEDESFAPPSDTLEVQLAQIWESLLGIECVGVKDNFFDLGGNSLLAARLFAEVHRLCAKNLPLATLFQFPTIEQLAGVLRKEGWSPSWSSLVAIQPKGSRPPFFFIHGVGGNIVSYRDLAAQLGPDVPVFGLQSQGLDGQLPPLKTIPEMAALYIREIRSLISEGPYYLGGISFGGLVAYEIAQQLHAAGQKVGVLAMLDTDPSYTEDLSTVELWAKRLRYLVNRPKQHWNSIARLKPGQRGPFIKAKIRTLKGRAQKWKWRMTSKFYDRISHPLPEAFSDIKTANLLAGMNYSLSPYPGSVTYFRAVNGSIVGEIDPESGWRKLAKGGVEVHDVPGGHLSILEPPNVEVLGQALKECLAKALEESPLSGA